MISKPVLSNGFERYISDNKLIKAKISPENEITFNSIANTCQLFLAPLSNLSGNVFTIRMTLMNAWVAIKKKTRLNRNDTSIYSLSVVLTVSRIKVKNVIAQLKRSR